MAKRQNQAHRVKARREGALDRLKHPSADLVARVAKFTNEQRENHNARVARNIEVLESRIAFA